MKNYSTFERIMARLLAKSPTFKKLIKRAYSYLNYFFLKKKGFLYKSEYEIFRIEESGYETFFGYYDHSPVNDTGQVICCLSSVATTDSPRTDKSIDIGIYDLNMSKFIFKIRTSAYNWQQGARARWLNGDLFIFNDFDSQKGSYISRVFSLEYKSQVDSFDLPIQDSFGFEYFLSINYRRLMALREDYGYRNLPKLEHEELVETDLDGVWKVDFQTKEKKLLVSISSLKKLKPLPEFDKALHKVNHVMISPSGDKFIFLHRYYLKDRRFDRLILADAHSGVLKLLSDYDFVSHCNWINNENLIAYMRGPNNKDGFWRICIEPFEITPCLNGKLDKYGDGHPSVHENNLISDTYPDKRSTQHLFISNMNTEEVQLLGSFHHGLNYIGETRCDLHPRFSPRGDKVFFDTVFTGKRCLAFIKLIDF